MSYLTNSQESHLREIALTARYERTMADPASAHNDTSSNTDEFAIELVTGRVVYTSGPDSIEALAGVLEKGEPITGSYTPNSTDYVKIGINSQYVVALIELDSP